MESFWTTFANGLAGAVGGIFGAIFTLWFQSRKERITKLDGNFRSIVPEALRVEYSAVKKDKKGFYIPGHGRINGWKEFPKLEDVPEVKRHGKNIAFIFVNSTSTDSEYPQYILKTIAPL